MKDSIMDDEEPAAGPWNGKMHTAPRDGEAILVWYKGELVERAQVVKWENYLKVWRIVGTMDRVLPQDAEAWAMINPPKETPCS